MEVLEWMVSGCIFTALGYLGGVLHASWSYAAQAAATPLPVRRAPGPEKPRGERILAHAPRVNGESLRDWLIHQHPSIDKLWARIVHEFYEEALARPEIAAYFDMYDAERIKRHFVAMLVMITHIGLTDGAAKEMEIRHDPLHIKPEHFDAIVEMLVKMLLKYKVPYESVEQLRPIVGELRVRLIDGGLFV